MCCRNWEQNRDPTAFDAPRLGQREYTDPKTFPGSSRPTLFRFLYFAIGRVGKGISIKRGKGYPRKSGDIMGKVMVSLTDEAEQLVRQEVDKLYYGRTGGFSIFFEGLVRRYFNGGEKKASTERRTK